MDYNAKSTRYYILLFNCLLTFGSYYCFDMPANLQHQIQDQIIAKFTNDTETYYNYFYLVYSWTNMLMSLCAGQMVDKMGKVKSMFIFVTFCMVGSAIYAVGAFMTESDAKLRYGVMFLGRFIFGLGGGPITIVQNTYTATWFTGHELAMAFGCTLTISRIGSVVNYDLTPTIYDAINTTLTHAEDPNTPIDIQAGHEALGYTLMIGSGLVSLSLIAALVLAHLDGGAEKSSEGPYKATGVAGKDSSGKKKKMSIDDLKLFPPLYWVLALTISLFYSIIFPFMANSSTFLEEADPSLTDVSASFRSGLVYMCSMFVSPFLGAFVDWLGRRTVIALFGTSLTIPVFILLGYSSLDPIYMMLMLGISYSVCAAALWPSIQLLVPLRANGTANGVATSIQMLGIGICNILVGRLRDTQSFSVTMDFFVGLGVASVACVLTMFVLDTDQKMFKGKRDAEKEAASDNDLHDPLLDAPSLGKAVLEDPYKREEPLV